MTKKKSWRVPYDVIIPLKPEAEFRFVQEIIKLFVKTANFPNYIGAKAGVGSEHRTFPAVTSNLARYNIDFCRRVFIDSNILSLKFERTGKIRWSADGCMG